MNSQSITFPSLPSYMVEASMSHSVPAFTDSVDSTNTYSVGICGEKLFELISPPAFLSVTLGTNKITDPFTINYDSSKVKESEVQGPSLVQYKVSFKDYDGLIPSL